MICYIFSQISYYCPPLFNGMCNFKQRAVKDGFDIFFYGRFLGQIIVWFFEQFFGCCGLGYFGTLSKLFNRASFSSFDLFSLWNHKWKERKIKFDFTNSLAQLCDVLQRRPCVLKNSVSLHKAKNRYFQHSN